LFGTGLTSPRGDYAKCVLHLFLTHDDVYLVFNSSANPPGHVAAIALAIERIYLRLDRSLNPRSEEPWFVSTMSYTAVASGEMV